MKELYKNKKHVVFFIISILVSAINFNLLLKPISIVCGGSGGLALVIEKIIHISTSHIIAIVYVITVILSIISLPCLKVYEAATIFVPGYNIHRHTENNPTI